MNKIIEMKLYRVSYRNGFGEHIGYEYFSNKADAIKRQNKNNNEAGNHESVIDINFSLSKKGVLELLNYWASRPDNG